MKKVFLSLLALAAMAGCSKNELSERPEGPLEIKVKSTALEVSTKAPYDGTITSSNPFTPRVIVSKTTGNYTTLFHDGTMTFEDNGNTAKGFSTPAYYPSDGATLYLCGLYPATNWAANQTTEASYTFDGKSDIMAAAEASSSKPQAQAGTFPALAFKHLLTKLVIKVAAENQAAIDAWGNVTDITLTKAATSEPYSKVTVTLADGTAATGTAFATTKASFPFYTMTGNTYNEDAFATQTLVLTTTPTNAAYSLVAPITATGTADFTLLVKATQGATEGVTVPVNLKGTDTNAFSGDTQGKAFEVTLTFKATEIQAKATVAAWETGGTASEEIK